MALIDPKDVGALLGGEGTEDFSSEDVKRVGWAACQASSITSGDTEPV